MNKPNLSKLVISTTFVLALSLSPLVFAHDPAEPGKENLSAAAEKTATGEIVDMMCYIDHNAIGEEHGKSCGAKCIKNGAPVGIVATGKADLVVGEHKPMNDQLAEYCGKMVTVKGKAADRGGIAMLENAEIVKK